MAQFKFPPISPLIGSTPASYIRTLWGRKIERKHYLKTFLTSVVVLVSALFQWYEKIYCNVKCRNYSLKHDPIFIIGHWRTGTTFLHNLLSKDPQMGYVTTYQTVFPNNLKSKFLFRTFMRIMIPPKRPGDNVRLNVAYPQEEEFALTNINPLNYYQFMYFPQDYREYYDKYVRMEGMTGKVYTTWKKDYVKMVKKAMLNTGGDIPLLKNPCNTGRIKVMLDMYPNAKFVFLQRNPVIVFLSIKKFFSELLPTLWFHTITGEELDAMIFDIYVDLINDYLNTRSLIPPENLVEIKFEEYEKDPLNFIKDLYNRFRISGFEKAKPNLQAYIESMSGYRKNRYEISRDLLDKIIEKWGFTMELWGYSMPENIEIK